MRGRAVTRVRGWVPDAFAPACALPPDFRTGAFEVADDFVTVDDFDAGGVIPDMLLHVHPFSRTAAGFVGASGAGLRSDTDHW
ncbi:hypothetical protein CJ177_38075 [Rhodococcus sp. ACPA1]|nr:hypothetical protein CJ177_38075 [Rhodococcus sp. ACPA1]